VASAKARCARLSSSCRAASRECCQAVFAVDEVVARKEIAVVLETGICPQVSAEDGTTVLQARAGLAASSKV